MEAARAQTIEESLSWPLRPVLTSLNGDNSWLFSIPRPADDSHKWFYHIVFEPWLNGPTSQLSSWLIWISLSAPPGVPDARAVEVAAQQIDDAAVVVAQKNGQAARAKPSFADDAYTGPLDCILLFFHYLDHSHEPTLKLFDKRIPVVGTQEAVDKIQKMQHFETFSLVTQKTEGFTTWQSPDMHPDVLPPWLTASKLLGQHELNFFGVLVWTHEDSSGQVVHEAILQSPHGMHMNQPSMEGFLASTPPVQNLAMMHGLKESWTLNWMTTLGAEGGLKMFRRIGGAKYWVPTHHSKLDYKGIITGNFANDIFKTLEWALGKEQQEGKALEAPNYALVENGGCVVLS